MPVPSSISDLSQTAGNNSPPGSESPTTADDYLRTYASYIALHRDGKGFSTEADVASASTCNIGAANSMFVRITGTTTITSFGTDYNGPRFIRFADALTLTHNASTLVLPGGANITTVAGDNYVAIPISGGWVVFGSAGFATGAQVKAGTDTGRVITPKTLRDGALVLGTATTLTGTSVDFTSIPSWAKRITVLLSGASTNGVDAPLIQLGDSGGIESSGYLGNSGVTGSATAGSVVAYTTGFGINGSGAAAKVLHGALTLWLLDASTNTWVADGKFHQSNSTNYVTVGGSKSLSGTLDRIRITTEGGSDSYDAGKVNILYE